MTREQASRIIADSRRFRVNRGRIQVRDAELATMIAAIKIERRPNYTQVRGAFVNS